MSHQGSGMRFGFKAGSLAEDSLSVLSFKLEESLSSPYVVELELLSRRDDIKASDLVDQSGVLSWWQDGECQRELHGIVSRFGRGDSGHRQTRYRLRLEPALSRLQLRRNSRIFQEKSLTDIIAVLFGEMGITDYAFRCDPRHESRKREYCVQYGESDFDFFERLTREAGLFYYFEHSSDKHTLVLCDALDKLSLSPYSYPYNALAGGRAEQASVRSAEYRHRRAESGATLKDYSFRKPAYSFLQPSTEDADWQQSGYEHFDYPGRYKDDADGKLFSKVRLAGLRRESEQLLLKSDQLQALSGQKFALSEHPDASLNREWVIVGVSHTGEQGNAAEEDNSSRGTTYSNEIVAVPSSMQWQAEPKAKPQMAGPQIATVVGPKDEEIFCDEYGRVKVQFPWDRYAKGDEHGSCWIRVSQGWAGGQYGFMALPRIGHEVIVSFLDGDPDQPIITGRAFHAVNQVPYALPAHKTRTVLKTQSHKGEGSNELRFEDEAGEEEIYLHAQKDLNLLTENDRHEHIKHDSHLDVDNERRSRIGGNDHLTVLGESRQQVTGDKSLIVDGSLHLKAGSVWVNETGDEIHIKAGQKVVLESSSEITVKAGGSFVKVDPAGVHLSGPGINLNAGGGAASGSGYGGKAPELPGEVAAAELPNPLPLQLAPASMEMLSYNNVAVARLCQKQTDGSCPLEDCPCLKHKG
ncbi:type VI secretion system Vgr family protein [Shewanella algae]|uniref:type VI secretion system Vgr family protein n=4 Tax=Shewanella algae TaxID=38313 RepID=UPI001AADED90|nr:type VI secretion system tip protein VgrG [Shewanella algae]QTE95770.1 type VI secretion system tip protein VgrG [Shewanella algae]